MRLIYALIAIVGLHHLRVCVDCDHLFDARDDRGFLPSKNARDLDPVCPACNQVARGAEAWAVHNDCQGVFEDGIRGRKAETDAIAEAWNVGAKSVPVRVIVEPEDRHDMRAWSEKHYG
jgi:hypothetical protein